MHCSFSIWAFKNVELRPMIFDVDRLKGLIFKGLGLKIPNPRAGVIRLGGPNLRKSDLRIREFVPQRSFPLVILVVPKSID